MSKKFVNRKLVVAAALAAGVMCGVGIKPALAGYWEQVPSPWEEGGNPAQAAEYYRGSVHEEWEDYYDEQNYDSWSSTTPHDGFRGEGFPIEIWPKGGNGLVNATLGRSTLFRWIRNESFDENWNFTPDPNDNPPETLQVLVTYGASASACSDTTMANRDPDYESSHVQVQVGNESQTKEGQDLGYATGAGINGKRLFKIATKGQELVSVPWLDVELTAQLDEGRFIYGQPVQGLIGAIMNYSAQVDNRSINWDVYPQGISYAVDTNSPTNKTFDAYVALGWKDDGVPDHPLMGFYQGGSSYSLTAAANGQNTILNNTLHNYQWSASPQTFVPQLPVPTEYERDQMTPAADTSNKTLHWDFGGDITSFPTDADVTATATDSSDGAQVSGHALIHWHSAWEGVDTSAGTDEPPYLILPPGTMVDIPAHLDENGQPVPASQKPVEQLQPDDKIKVQDKPLNRKVVSVTPQNDGTYKVVYGLDPDDNPDDPAYDLNQQIERAQDAYQEAVKQGATGVKYGLEAYKTVAEFYAYGPLYELGGAALGQLGPKALELLQSGVKAEEAAAKLRGMAGLQRTLLARARQLLGQGGHTAEEIAALEAKAKQLEAVAQKLEAGASEAESLAAQAKKVGQNAKDGADYIQQSKSILDDAGGNVVSYNPLNPGPLAVDLANTFRGASYASRTIENDVVLYRVIAEEGNPAGGYWTPVKPTGPLQSVIDFALDQNWGNTATHIVEARIPAGTTIYEGAATAQRGLLGGGCQVYIPQVDPTWITSVTNFTIP